MKKYAQHTVILLVIIGFSCVLAGCKARRDVARVSVAESTIERVEETIDTSRIYIEMQIETHVQEETQDNTFIRTTEFDPTGTVVVRIQEEWRDIGRTQLFVSTGQGHHLSINNVLTTSVERDSTIVIATEVSKTLTDSRLMSGRMWIVIVVSFIGAVVLMIYARKRRCK